MWSAETLRRSSWSAGVFRRLLIGLHHNHQHHVHTLSRARSSLRPRCSTHAHVHPVAVLAKPSSSRSFCTASDDSADKTAQTMREKLQSTFSGEDLVHIEDKSGGCGSFFEVLVVSDKFNGKRMVQQHQMVNKILAEEIERMHGITVSTLTHQEYQKQLADQEL